MTPRQSIDDKEGSVRELPTLLRTHVGHLGVIYVSALAARYTQKRRYIEVVFLTF
jgi:hypothetical protein